MANQDPNAPIPSPTPGTPTVDLAVSRLLNDTSVSSQNTNLEKILSATASGIEATKEAREASRVSIEGAFGRKQQEAAIGGLITETQSLEGTRGFAVPVAALTRLRDVTKTQLADLEQRKQELLLQNDAQAAAQISQLQFKALEFEEQAKQRTFSNLLSLAGLGLQQAESARAERALNIQERSQNFQERSAINSIALQFGVTPTEGDTLESIVARVAPFASEKQKLDIARTRAEIARADAETRKAMAGMDFELDDVTASGLASTINSLYEQGKNEEAAGVLGQIMKTKGLAGYNKIKTESSKQVQTLYSPQSVGLSATKAAANGVLKSEFLFKYEDLQNKGIITPSQFKKISEQIDLAYVDAPYKTPEFVERVGGAGKTITKSFFDLVNPSTYFGK